MIGSNYGGKVGNNTANVRGFNLGYPLALWRTITYNNEFVLTPITENQSVYIQGNLYVDGTIVNPSDLKLKDKIEDLSDNITNKIMKIRPTQFEFNSDTEKTKHYGFIAQEFEEHFPELVVSKVDKTMEDVKGINYLEIVPLLVYQIQRMQNEIDDLKQQINNK
jgi:hypothetical protein